MAHGKIVNEDFRDKAEELQSALNNQLGGDKVIGCSMFFLVREGIDPNKASQVGEPRTYWMVISNYNEPLSDGNLLYLHQSVARHLARDFSCVDYGPDEEKL